MAYFTPAKTISFDALKAYEVIEAGEGTTYFIES